jgi:uncharacterized protein (DUF3084 family)
MNKLSEKELQDLNEIQQQSNNIIFSLGELVLQKEGLVDQFRTLSAKQNEMGKILTEKYGDGKINLNNGEIIPMEEKDTTTPTNP